MLELSPQNFIALGPLKLNTWGIFVVLGGFLGIALALKRAEGKLTQRQLLELAVWLLLAVFAGARAAYVLVNWDKFVGNFWEIFALHRGGLASAGGFGAGIFTGWLWAKAQGRSFRQLGDWLAPAAALSYSLGRLGNLAIGYPLGRQTETPWALEVAGESFHPVPLYLSLLSFLIFVGLLLVGKTALSGKRPGFIFGLWLALYGAGRGVLEFFFAQGPFYFGLTSSGWAGLALFAVGLGLLVWPQGRAKGRPPPLVRS